MSGDFASLNTRKNQLIRKAKEGTVFVDTMKSDILTSITEGAEAALSLPPTLVDGSLGWFTEDGVSFAGDVQESNINSWGALEPTRREITTDTTTISVTAQETNLINIGLYTGNDFDALKPDPTTGELIVTKPPRPRLRHFRTFALAVDEYEGEEVYIGRYLPRASVSRAPEQVYTGGDTALTWGLTFTSSVDSEAGYSERYFFAGPGWKAMLEEAGFNAGDAPEGP